MNNGFQKCCGAPCKYEPIVMPVKEMVCNKYVCVEQPIICPVNKRIVTHYVPKPVYYHTYSQNSFLLELIYQYFLLRCFC